MKDILFLLSDLWLMATTWTYGIKLWRNYRNLLLTLEWLVVAVSSTNFLFWSLLGGDKSSPLYDLAYALDAFSRSFGITLILVIGLLSVTHGYKPPVWVKVGTLTLAVAGALVFGRMHSDHLVHDFPHLALATFYVVINLLTTAFLAYFATRLWQAGATKIAVATAIVTAAGCYVAVTYDFSPFSFDDANRTIFYTLALTVWGAQAMTYYYAYKAMDEHNEAAGAMPARTASTAA
ncbi:hypothetical protein [Marmoricola sp. URHB0036]|uniref:hypothetical protein n=1 Tax=Marmoricola sp. URHB0036 TaxID=1298863 RepID=UPI00042143A7|nr:hypothetical protein [Marmoricola sp. URHB0036]